MAETARQRPVDYYNPRPLILGVCFFWGVIMGFCLYFFRAPEQRLDNTQEQSATAALPPVPVQSELERRRMDAPSIAAVEPAPAIPAASRPTLEQIQLEPPPALLTTEGGLTGRNARMLGNRMAQPPPRIPFRQGPMTPPPLPELMP